MDALLAWLGKSSPIQWLTFVAACWWSAVRVGEWKRRREEPPRTAETVSSAVRLAIETAARQARHEAVDAANAALGDMAHRMEARFDKVGDEASKLASRVQGLPTRAELDAVQKDLDRLRAQVADAAEAARDVSERVARIEGPYHRRS